MDKRKIISNSGKAITFMLFPLFGYYFGLKMGSVIIEGMDLFSLPLNQFYIGLIFIFVFGLFGFFIHVIVHEAGHLIFGLLTGYTFISYRILSFIWVNENGQLHFKRHKVSFALGQCLMSPPELDRNGKLPYLLYNFGGVIMNAIACLIALIILIYFKITSFIGIVCFIFIFIGILLIFSNGWPTTTNSINNDGMNALDIASHPEAPRAFWITLKIGENLAKGIRLKDMPDSWFEVPSYKAMENGMIANIGVYACARLIDQRQFKEADLLIKSFLSSNASIIPLYRTILTCERVFMELIGENRKEVIDNLLDKKTYKLMKIIKNDPSVLRVLYAYHLLGNRDQEKALQFKKQFEKVAIKYPYPNEIKAERELFQLVDEINKRV